MHRSLACKCQRMTGARVAAAVAAVAAAVAAVAAAVAAVVAARSRIQLAV